MNKIFTAILLLIASSLAIANDTYDPNTKQLTIPSLTVGSVTYTNVIVRLNSIDVLKIDSNPLQGIILDNFIFQFNGCSLQGRKLACTITITSQYRDSTISISNGFSSNDNTIMLIDNKSNIYDPSFIQIANILDDASIINFPLVADLPTPIIIKFDNIATNASGLALLQFGKVAFRNQPFQ